VLRVRKSRSIIYSADFAAMNTLVGYLMENCCGGSKITHSALCGIHIRPQKRK
jgi:hypothetical protein